MNTKTIIVPLTALNELRKLIKKIGTKAKRCNVPAPIFDIQDQDRFEKIQCTSYQDEEGNVSERSYAVWCCKVVITLDVAVRMQGQWKFVAALQRNENNTLEPFAEGHENKVVARKFLETHDELLCSHCQKRRTRNTTLLFRNADDNTFIQVGRECAQEYGFDATELVNLLEFQSFLSYSFGGGDEEMFWGGSGGLRANPVYDTEEVVSLLLIDQVQVGRPFQKTKVKDHNGFWQENEVSTKNQLLRMLNCCMLLEERPNDGIIGEHRTKLLDWARSLPEDKLNDSEYLASIHDILLGDYVSEKRIGLLASAYAAYVRDCTAAVVKEVPTTPAPAGRVPVRGVVKSMRLQENDFGSTWKMLVVLDDNNKVWCSVPNDSPEEIKVNDAIVFKATFVRSDKDEHFSFGSRPTTKLKPKEQKLLAEAA
jgi:hypothetical protein